MQPVLYIAVLVAWTSSATAAEKPQYGGFPFHPDSLNSLAMKPLAIRTLPFAGMI